MDIQALTNILNPDQISTDKEILQSHGKDWTKHFTADPAMVVFPKSTEDVQKSVKWAIKENVNLVPSGGRTGLSAGAYALNKEVVVSFDKMNQILSFNEIEKSVHCQAGVITEALQNYALDKNLYYPIDFAARGSSQIGGNVATNAGGTGCPWSRKYLTSSPRVVLRATALSTSGGTLTYWKQYDACKYCITFCLNSSMTPAIATLIGA